MERVREYAEAMKSFRAQLLVLRHMSGGQPARGTELVTVQYKNGADGDVRGLFVEDGLAVFVTMYSKTMGMSAKAKVIHRYLPREVGELAVYYVWLAIPFWRSVVQGASRGAADWSSPYIWEPRADEAWAFPGAAGEGQGTHTAGLVYARELQQGAFGTATRRDRFRAVSRAWHRFFGLGAEDRAGGGRAQAEAEAGYVRQHPGGSAVQGVRAVTTRRHSGAVESHDGTGGAVPGDAGAGHPCGRPGGEPGRAGGGHGAGKSMSVMLPAFCSPDGVTVVVVPLVALRDDLQGRCERSGIEAHVWQSQGPNRAAPIVFVTPESAVTKGFRASVNRLQARGSWTGFSWTSTTRCWTATGRSGRRWASWGRQRGSSGWRRRWRSL